MIIYSLLVQSPKLLLIALLEVYYCWLEIEKCIDLNHLDGTRVNRQMTYCTS